MINVQTIQGVKIFSLDPVLFDNWAVKASITIDLSLIHI